MSNSIPQKIGIYQQHDRWHERKEFAGGKLARTMTQTHPDAISAAQAARRLASTYPGVRVEVPVEWFSTLQMAAQIEAVSA